MIEFVPALAMLALVKKLVDLLRYLRGGDINGVVTQLVAWAGGVGVVLLAAQTDYAGGIEVGGEMLSTLNVWSLALIGLAVGSSASLADDALKSVDQNRSGDRPALVEE